MHSVGETFTGNLATAALPLLLRSSGLNIRFPQITFLVNKLKLSNITRLENVWFGRKSGTHPDNCQFDVPTLHQCTANSHKSPNVAGHDDLSEENMLCAAAPAVFVVFRQH